MEIIFFSDQDSEKPFWGRSKKGILRQKRVMLFWDSENEACLKQNEDILRQNESLWDRHF